MRRKKKDGDAEKAASEQPKQTPLQPDFYEAQASSDSIGNSVEDNIGNVVEGNVAQGNEAPARPAPALPPIDDDNRWNRIDADLLPPPRAAAPRSFERPPRRQAPSRSAAPRPPRVVARPEAGETFPERTAASASASAEGREPGPGRGRRRRGRRGRGRSKPEVSTAAVGQAPLRPSSVSDPSTFEASADPVAAPRPAARAVSSDPAAPKKYKGVVVLSIGLPGSGKSSWFKRNNITPLSSDLLRGLLFDDPNEQRFQDLVFSNLRSLLRARLVARRPMNYVDATNLSPHERQGWIKLAHDYGYEVQAVYFDVPLEVCLDRNRKRQRVVAEDVMRRMSTKLQPPTFEEGFTKITNVRVKKKEGDDAPAEAAAEVVDLSASDGLASDGLASDASTSDGSGHSHAPGTPEEIGVATETVE